MGTASGHSYATAWVNTHGKEESRDPFIACCLYSFFWFALSHIYHFPIKMFNLARSTSVFTGACSARTEPKTMCSEEPSRLFPVMDTSVGNAPPEYLPHITNGAPTVRSGMVDGKTSTLSPFGKSNLTSMRTGHLVFERNLISCSCMFSTSKQTEL